MNKIPGSRNKRMSIQTIDMIDTRESILFAVPW